MSEVREARRSGEAYLQRSVCFAVARHLSHRAKALQPPLWPQQGVLAILATATKVKRYTVSKSVNCSIVLSFPARLHLNEAVLKRAVK